MKMRLPVLFAQIFLIAFTAQAGQNPAAKSVPDVLIPKAQRKTAPDFTLVDAQGKPITLSAFKGKVVLLDFWAVDCGGCKLEIPWYVEFDQKYRQQGLAVVGVTMYDEGWDIVKPFMAKQHMDYPVVLGNDQLAARYALNEMPMTLLIDPSGNIALSHVGVVNKNDFESHIRELLK
jgi:peroxiredoxin